VATFYTLDLHEVRSKSRHRTLFLPEDPVYIGENAPKCDACGGFIGMLPWLTPLHAELEAWGASFGDLAVGPGNDVLLSERFMKVIAEYNLKGFQDLDPVTIVKVKRHNRRLRGQDPPTYIRATVGRASAAFDQKASEFVWSGDDPVCPVCRTAHHINSWKRLILEEGTWEGEDIFIARGLCGTYLASERFKSVVEQESLTNIVLVPAEEYSYSYL
jgi:hypothetical protein